MCIRDRINLPLGPLTLYAGVRFEHSGMDLKSYTRSKEWTSKTTRYDYTDLFPSVNLTWKLSEAHQLRAAYGRSTNQMCIRDRLIMGVYNKIVKTEGHD